ncbi:hypothetical protein AM218_06715 [Hymenobacter sp. DG25A]|nr:hypothetical protein AM218_06715 [Hymenobacter sp. DG25A]
MHSTGELGGIIGSEGKKKAPAGKAGADLGAGRREYLIKKRFLHYAVMSSEVETSRVLML